VDRWTRNIIAVIHHSAKVWITYTEYTILESHLDGVILDLRYGNDIPMINRFSRIVVRWRYHQF
jgi:hypothetical protein